MCKKLAIICKNVAVICTAMKR